MTLIWRIAFVTLVATSLLACGGGGSSSPETGPLTLRVTDSPIDASTIDGVCIDFTRITVHYAGQDDVVLNYAPLPSQVSPATHCVTGGVWTGGTPVPPVRLSALGGPLTVALAESLQIPVGRVTWIRLHFAGGSYVLDSAGGQHELRCPSCDVTDNNDGRGFKLNRTFEVTGSGLAVTVDVDLLKSLHENTSGYVLRPTARIELDETLGTIAGTVDAAVITGGCAVFRRHRRDGMRGLRLRRSFLHAGRPLRGIARGFHGASALRHRVGTLSLCGRCVERRYGRHPSAVYGGNHV